MQTSQPYYWINNEFKQMCSFGIFIRKKMNKKMQQDIDAWDEKKTRENARFRSIAMNGFGCCCSLQKSCMHLVNQMLEYWSKLVKYVGEIRYKNYFMRHDKFDLQTNWTKTNIICWVINNVERIKANLFARQTIYANHRKSMCKQLQQWTNKQNRTKKKR